MEKLIIALIILTLIVGVASAALFYMGSNGDMGEETSGKETQYYEDTEYYEVELKKAGAKVGDYCLDK